MVTDKMTMCGSARRKTGAKYTGPRLITINAAANSKSENRKVRDFDKIKAPRRTGITVFPQTAPER